MEALRVLTVEQSTRFSLLVLHRISDSYLAQSVITIRHITSLITCRS
jgi:hypothetical protein